MKKLQLRQLIREEIKKSVNEGFTKNDWNVKWKLPQDNLFNASKTIDAVNNRSNAIQDLLKLNPKKLQAFNNDDEHPAIKMSYNELMRWYYSIMKESVNEGSRTLQVTDGNGRLVLITDPKDIKNFLAGEEVYGEDPDGELIGVSIDSALDHQMAEGTCGYDTDAKTGKKLTTPGGLKESALELGYLSEVKISRNIEIDIVGNDIMIKQGDKDFGKLVGLNIAYIEGTDRLYRGYLHTENKQLNLNGGESGLFEFYDAVGAGRGAEVEEFFSKYGVEITSSEFDVS